MLKIDVNEGDVLLVKADVLALKYAQASYGVDAIVLKKLINLGPGVVLPEVGGIRLFDNVPGIAARSVLFVGVPPLEEFMYREIRQFARKAFSSLASRAPQTALVAMTLHGAGYGLDEAEAFESEVAGIVDAYQDGDAPDALEQVLIVEHNHGRATRLKSLLADLVPGGHISGKRPEDNDPRNPTERLRAAGYASATKDHVFVAMPFKEEMEDVYHYAIQSAARAAGFICERADMATFTGEVMGWVKSRIKSASLVVADLTDANPNVYLEVGYAWGCGVETVLLAKNVADLTFDVRAHRCLVYKTIKQLEEALAKELEALKSLGG